MCGPLVDTFNMFMLTATWDFPQEHETSPEADFSWIYVWYERLCAATCMFVTLVNTWLFFS